MKAEFFYEEGETKTFPFPFVHAMAGFALPKDYKKRDLRIVVLNPKGKRIYSVPIPKKKKKKKKQDNSNNIVWFDKTYKKE